MADIAYFSVPEDDPWDVLRRLVASEATSQDAVKTLRSRRDGPMLVEALLHWCAESVRNPGAIALEHVTPVLAGSWLRKNGRNRNLRKKDVEKYARDMVEGRWSWTGDSIKFDRDGVLIDGQHRLEAVIRAGVGVNLLVVRGLAPEAQFDIDRAIPRQIQDVFKIQGRRNASTLAAVARVVANWERGHRWDVTTGTDPVSQSEIQALLDLYPELEDIASRARNRDFAAVSPRLTSQLVGLSMWLFERIDKDAAAVFFGKLASGTDLVVGDPVLLLRTDLFKNRDKERSNKLSLDLAVIVEAWNLHHLGDLDRRRLNRTKFAKGGAKFPEPI